MTDHSAAPHQPLVSVVIPAFNHAAYLRACLESVWFQEYPQIELVVVNPASTDSTALVLEQFNAALESETVSFASRYDLETDTVRRTTHDRYPKEGRSIRIISLPADPGLPETYNIGIRESSGPLVTTIAADDRALPHMISTMVRSLQDTFDIAYSDMHLIDDAGHILRSFRLPNFDPQRCLCDWYLMGVSRLWRRNLHEEVGWFSPEYRCAHDYDLFVRFVAHGARVTHVAQVLYELRWHDERRKTGSHAPDVEPLIHQESKQVALTARRLLPPRSLGV